MQRRNLLKSMIALPVIGSLAGCDFDYYFRVYNCEVDGPEYNKLWILESLSRLYGIPENQLPWIKPCREHRIIVENAATYPGFYTWYLMPKNYSIQTLSIWNIDTLPTTNLTEFINRNKIQGIYLKNIM